MTARLLEGKPVAEKIRERVRTRVADLKSAGVEPCLATVLVGDDPASQSYVRGKEKACAKLGIATKSFTPSPDIGMDEMLKLVGELNADPEVHGILVQLPLPGDLDEAKVTMAIDPDKDVDGLHPVSLGKLLSGKPGFVSCTPQGIQVMLLEYGIEIEGQDIVIVGRSNIVGKPLANLLIQKANGANATVTLCHTRTRDLAAHTRRADILVVAAGRPGVVTADMIRPGGVVVDVGVNRVPDDTRERGYRLVGDVDFEAAREVASAITPVPGGVGPLTITMLLSNTVQAAAAISAGS
jgi:methylenetetrahydrofolate dehydrogenase (NADP+)/methenyltetrahydrofolate cyclohydrolase